MIEQICEFVGNEDPELVFYFFGTDEDKKILDSMLDEKGLSEAKTILQPNEAKKMKAFQAAELKGTMNINERVILFIKK